MVLMREQLSVLDLSELGASCELLEHPPSLFDWEEWIVGTPDAKHGRQDPAMHGGKTIEHGEVQITEELQLSFRPLFRPQQRPHEKFAELAVGVCGVGENATEAQGRSADSADTHACQDKRAQARVL